MKKLSVLVLLGGLVVAAMMRGKRQSGKERPSKWEKMKKAMEEMPEDFPPRVMFDNIAVARENTDRILEILDKSGNVADDVAD